MDMMVPQQRSRLWIWIILIWLGFGMIDAAQTTFGMREEGMHHAWTKLFVVTAFFWLPWALATVPVIRLGRRFPPVHVRPIGTWAVHVTACFTICTLFTGWAAWLERFFNIFGTASFRGTFAQLWFQKFFSSILPSIVLYAGILAVSHVLESNARLAFQQTDAARLNEQLSIARLDALRNQIAPHFLFNALNAVSSLVRSGEDQAAVTMIASLSDVLRHTLDGSSLQEVPLQTEMDFTRKYLDIQKVRFAERLRISVDVPNELYRARVPSLILQPMVENAIKHGISKTVQGGMIQITAFRLDGILTLSVFNDGPGLTPNSTPSGIGILNIQSRLQALYGNGFEVTLRDRESGGVEASVSLPFALAEKVSQR